MASYFMATTTATVASCVAAVLLTAISLVSLLPSTLALLLAVATAFPALVLCAVSASIALHLFYADNFSLVKHAHPLRSALVAIAVFDYLRGLIASRIALRVITHWLRRLRLLAPASSLTNASSSSSSSSSLNVITTTVQYLPSHSLYLDIHHTHIHSTGSTAAAQATRPVIVFIYGGAWNSGSKDVYAPLGAHFASVGCVTVVPDYRKYPQAQDSAAMCDDVAVALKWVAENIAHYGGDATKIHTIAHSAGAQLVARILLENALFHQQNTAAEHTPSPLFELKEILLASGYLFTEHVRELETKGSTRAAMTRRDAPRLASVVFMGGVFNLVQQYYREMSRGVQDISALWRANGASMLELGAQSPTFVASGYALCVAKRDSSQKTLQSQTPQQQQQQLLLLLLVVVL